MKCPVKKEELREFVIMSVIGLKGQLYRSIMIKGTKKGDVGSG